MLSHFAPPGYCLKHHHDHHPHPRRIASHRIGNGDHLLSSEAMDQAIVLASPVWRTGLDSPRAHGERWWDVRLSVCTSTPQVRLGSCPSLPRLGAPPGPATLSPGCGSVKLGLWSPRIPWNLALALDLSGLDRPLRLGPTFSPPGLRLTLHSGSRT
jgi:hypothetical protein